MSQKYQRLCKHSPSSARLRAVRKGGFRQGLRRSKASWRFTNQSHVVTRRGALPAFCSCQLAVLLLGSLSGTMTGSCTVISMSSKAIAMTGRPMSTPRRSSRLPCASSWQLTASGRTRRTFVASWHAYRSITGQSGVKPEKLGRLSLIRGPVWPNPAWAHCASRHTCSHDLYPGISHGKTWVLFKLLPAAFAPLS